MLVNDQRREASGHHGISDVEHRGNLDIELSTLTPFSLATKNFQFRFLEGLRSELGSEWGPPNSTWKGDFLAESNPGILRLPSPFSPFSFDSIL
jgi:hypothetical protein